MQGWIALGAVYAFWGSTYLAIRIGVEHIPPFALGASRYLIAGGSLYAVTFRGARGAREWRSWRSAFILGLLLLIGGNGGVIWGERTVPSGIASLLVALVPFWLVLFDAVRQRRLVGPMIVAGLLIAFAGVALLVKPAPGHVVDPVGAAVIVGAGIAWAIGSIYSRSAPQAEPPLAAVAMQMLSGGAVFAVLSLASGELSHLQWSPVGAAAVLWLVVAGSFLGFSGYIYALKLLPISTVSTYGFVNPLIAVLLGWLILGEALTWQTGLAMATTVVGVILLLLKGVRR